MPADSRFILAIDPKRRPKRYPHVNVRSEPILEDPYLVGEIHNPDDIRAVGLVKGADNMNWLEISLDGKVRYVKYNRLERR